MVWAATDDRKLGRKTRALIDRYWRPGHVYVSAIAFWEAALLQMRRRVTLPSPVSEWRVQLLSAGLVELAVDGVVAIRSLDLRGISDDPADRFIAATAIELGATLVTADECLLGWNHMLPRHDARA
jgi:PIN domain nuclease of toxin-antitoxin system